MAGIKISALPAAASSLLTDVGPFVQAGVTVKETLQQIMDLFEANIVITDANFSGVLALNHGGTNAALVAANGGIVFSNATQLELLAPTITAGQILRSGSSAAPSWSTATFASTYAVSTLLHASASNTVTGLATVNRAALSTNATGVPTWLALTDGQVVVGSTAGAPAAASLTAGAGIAITPGSNSISIAATGVPITSVEVTAASAAIAVNTAISANRGTLVTLTLPVTAAFGTFVYIIGQGAGGWLVAQNAGQQIHVGTVSSTIGVGGSVASNNAHDCMILFCTVADTEWVAFGVQGLLTIV